MRVTTSLIDSNLVMAKLCLGGYACQTMLERFRAPQLAVKLIVGPCEDLPDSHE